MVSKRWMSATDAGSGSLALAACPTNGPVDGWSNRWNSVDT